MKKIVKRIVFLLALALLTGAPLMLPAQCPMCRMSAESNLKNGGTDGLGLNAGILYMLTAPYLLVAGMGYWWWRNRRRDSEDAPEEPEDDDIQ